MSKRDPVIPLRQMLDFAREAAAMTHGRQRLDLDTNRMLNLALTRLVEMIGEAASRVDPVIQQQHKNIPWRAIIGARNRLVHGYDEINLDVLWDIAQVGLPGLIPQIEAIVGSP